MVIKVKKVLWKREIITGFSSLNYVYKLPYFVGLHLLP
jgi:hypothetical protein